MIDILIGLQYGDEGKGKIIDFLSDNYDIICRFQGGPNAGHSICFDDKKYVLHHLPSGIFKDKINVIGNGCVINPIELKKEIEEMKDYINLDKLYISNRAHLITPYHIEMDKLNENEKGDSKIGSTLKGIGPTYTEKISRIGLRIGDIFDDSKMIKLKSKIIKSFLSNSKFEILALSDTEENRKYIDSITKEFFDAIEFLKTLKIIDTSYFLNWELKNGSKILAEGAQGALLDVDFGTYPYVTSSNTTVGGVITGLGISPRYIGKIYGVTKAYATRVGNGSFPTELEDETGQKMRDIGQEYGATTGRPRRCGWLDLPSLKYAIMINGVTDVIITKADVLKDFKTINVCNKYEVKGRETEKIPYDLSDATPLYQKFNGWSDVGYDSVNLKYFAHTIEKYLDTRVSHISISSDRNGIITM